MYNRYIPQPDGSYHRNRISEPEKQQPQSPLQPAASQKHEVPHNAGTAPPNDSIMRFFKNLMPKDMDTGDLIVILLLLLLANDCEEDRNHALLTLALYFLL